MKTKVVIIKCENYSYDNLQGKIFELINHLGGIKKFIKPGYKVLLKPNLLGAYNPKRVITTHPGIVMAVGQIAKDAGAKLFIGDSPSFTNYNTVLIKTNIKDVAEKLGAKILNFKTMIEYNTPTEFIHKKFKIAKEVLGFDLIINLPKFKTHNFTLFTGAVKNIFGVIPGLQKSTYHLKLNNSYDFSYMLVELHKLISPGLCIMDAIIGMDGNGPVDGNIRQIGLLIGSENGFALDWVATKIAGLENVPTVQISKKLGLFDEVEIIGESLDNTKIKDFKLPLQANKLLPDKIKKILGNIIIAKPKVNYNKCTLCQKCKKICPPQAIYIKRKKIRIDYSKCIRCYCCNEACASSAMKITDTLISKFVNCLK